METWAEEEEEEEEVMDSRQFYMYLCPVGALLAWRKELRSVSGPLHEQRPPLCLQLGVDERLLTPRVRTALWTPVWSFEAMTRGGRV